MSKVIKIFEKEIEPEVIKIYGKFYVYENVRQFLEDKYSGPGYAKGFQEGAQHIIDSY